MKTPKKIQDKILVIVNPTSGGGAGRRQWPRIQKLLEDNLDAFDVEETSGPGDARTIAERAARDGYSLLIACGGDGTVHEVTNGIVDSGRTASVSPTLGIVCVGTGEDFIKTLGIPKDLKEQARIAVRGKDRVIDLGRVDFTNEEGKRTTRHVINIVSAGLGAEVTRRVHRSRALFGKKLAYLSSTLESYWAWTPSPVTIQTDGLSKTPLPEKPLLVVVANGRYFGGGMPIAPNADPSDGAFDLIVVGPVNPLKIPLVLALLYSKRFYDLDEVYYDRVRSVKLIPKGKIGLDIDGEPIGSLPASFEVVPKALTVKVP